MAKKSTATSNAKIVSPKKKRPGVHSKKTTSVHKSSKNWKKPYHGQGRWTSLVLQRIGSLRRDSLSWLYKILYSPASGNRPLSRRLRAPW